MSYTLDDCFRALDAVGSKPRWHKNGNEIRAVCPAHPATSDDGLQITLFNDGGLRPKCYSGCARDAVLEAMGLRKQSGTRPNPQRRPPKDDPPPEPRPLPSGAPWWKPWIYTDVEGTPVFAVVRKDLAKNLETGKMKKTFRQFTPAPDAPGLWLPGGIEENRPLYRLPEILGALRNATVRATVRVVEGKSAPIRRWLPGPRSPSPPGPAGRGHGDRQSGNRWRGKMSRWWPTATRPVTWPCWNWRST